MEIKIDFSRPETLPPEEVTVLFHRGWPWNDHLGFMKRNRWGRPVFYIENISGDPTRIKAPESWEPEEDAE